MASESGQDSNLDKSVWACGVCDVEMEEKTPSIVCVCCRQWVHLKCAKLTPKEAKKLHKSKRRKFECSRCLKQHKSVKKVSVPKVRNISDFLDIEQPGSSTDGTNSAAEPIASMIGLQEEEESDASCADKDVQDDLSSDNDNDIPDPTPDPTSELKDPTPKACVTDNINFYIEEGEGMMGGNAQTIDEMGIKSGRKRRSDPESWKANQKRKYTKGSQGKTMRDPCKCRMKCFEKIDDDERMKIMKEYWDLKSLDRQRDFHVRFVQTIFPERGRTRERLKSGRANPNYEETSRRQLTRLYHLGEVKVCQVMYCNTLGISFQTVTTALLKKGVLVAKKDRRGGNRRKHTDGRENIRRHIKLFPIKDSHYCRKQTLRQYLHERLSVAIMYKLYQKWCERNKITREKLHMYMDVFRSDFNLNFYKRKKDQCLLCNAFENLNLSPSYKRLIFREQDLMKAMSVEELRKYNVSKINLLIDENGEKEKLPERGNEEQYIHSKMVKFMTSQDTEDGSDDDEEELNSDDEEEEDDNEVQKVADLDPDDVFVKWRQHLYNVEMTRKLKQDSKQLAKDSDNVVYCCFDLQQVLDCPYSNVGDMFYKRCLSSYNFVVTDCENAHCYFWSEDHGNRGVNEIGSNLIDFAQKKAREGKRHIVGFCDGCGGQNKNRPIAATLSYIVSSTPILSMFLCFLEKGHTENSADDIHSLIERAKVTSVSLPSDWPVLMRQINTDLHVDVKHQRYSDFNDVKDYFQKFTNYHKNREGETIINWKKVKIIKVTKADPHLLMFKMRYNDLEYQTIDMVQTGGKRYTKRDPTKIPNQMKKAYTSRLPISREKYDDLMSMCDGLIIPKEHQQFYRDLPVA